MSTKPDSLVPYPDGRLKLTLDGKPYTLRRPTIGEQWAFDESYVDVVEREREDADWAREQLEAAGVNDISVDDGESPIGKLLGLARSIDPREANKRKRAREEALVGWWQEVFAKLCSNLPDIPMDDLPPFLRNYATVGLAQEAWARNPQAPGDD